MVSRNSEWWRQSNLRVEMEKWLIFFKSFTICIFIHSIDLEMLDFMIMGKVRQVGIISLSKKKMLMGSY